MPPVLDVWFDFASTYSYPAVMRIGPLAENAGVAVRFRPFLLGPIFKAQGFATSPFNLYPAKGRHMWRDLERLCADLGLPFRRPDPFPQNSLLAARVALAGLAEDCDDKDWGEDFCRAVFQAEFGDGRRIDDAATITDILLELSIEPEPVLAAARSDAIKAQLRAETEAAERLGIFGAPSFTTADGELFWGNDRLEQALKWAKRAKSE
jgi:2-hydroxychromene-2-carboxylate isomerase